METPGCQRLGTFLKRILLNDMEAGMRQKMEHLLLPERIGIRRDLFQKIVAGHQLHRSLSGLINDMEDGFSLQVDAHLRLVIPRPVQAASVEKKAHLRTTPS